MTREEREQAIALLQSKINWSKLKTYPYISDSDANIYQSIIELLEQEPILDKIRAEIIQMPTISLNANDIYKADVLAIIDKYRQEV